MFQVKRKGFSWENIIMQAPCDTFRHVPMAKTNGHINCLHDILYFII